MLTPEWAAEIRARIDSDPEYRAAFGDGAMVMANVADSVIEAIRAQKPEAAMLAALAELRAAVEAPKVKTIEREGGQIVRIVETKA